MGEGPQCLLQRQACCACCTSLGSPCSAAMRASDLAAGSAQLPGRLLAPRTSNAIY